MESIPEKRIFNCGFRIVDFQCKRTTDEHRLTRMAEGNFGLAEPCVPHVSLRA